MTTQPARQKAKETVFQRTNIPALLAAASTATKPLETKEDLSSREFIGEVWTAVVALRRKGYTIAQVAEWLVEQGALAAPATLATAIQKEGQTRRKPGAKRPPRSRASAGNTGRLRPAYPPANPDPPKTGDPQPKPLARGGRSPAFDDDV